VLGRNDVTSRTQRKRKTKESNITETRSLTLLRVTFHVCARQTNSTPQLPFTIALHKAEVHKIDCWAEAAGRYSVVAGAARMAYATRLA
jgi:hypothetical protein